MAYRLEDGESVREGLRRTAREQLTSAIDSLSEGIDHDPAKAIHDARKSLKKERSLLRLGRASFRQAERRRENAGFREAARRLSASRDAEVMIAALDELAERYAGQAPKRAFASIRRRLAQDRTAAKASAEDGAAAGRTLENLRAARFRVDDWTLRRDGWKAVEAGLLTSYRRGRRAAQQARSEPTAENLHTWRKRTKDHWYHLRLLRPLAPHIMRGQAEEAHELADLLGDDHDLAVLRDRLERIAGNLSAEVDAVNGVLDHRRAELQADAFHLGDRVYAEGPKSFMRRMRRYWKSWRSQTAKADRREPAELADARGAPARDRGPRTSPSPAEVRT
jgi:CHAD domain-containing protein